jgi:pimeloyl-ACP methyl ester carboxylesterase
VRARFDIVGFDPRGIARSTALRCFGTPRQWGPFFTPFAFPLTPDEEEAWMAADLYVVDACAQRGGRIIDHMSTANVARDLDVLREAVGDAKLTYYGVSYGSFLGQTYANLFPDKFRALVIDGVLDPIAWVNQGGAIPFSTRLRSDAGAIATLNEFFRLCDEGADNCAFAPDSAERYAALAQKLLDDGPVAITFPDGSGLELNYSVLGRVDARADVRLVELGELRRPSGLPRGSGHRNPTGGHVRHAPPGDTLASRLHHEARLPDLPELHRGLSRSRVRGQRQPGLVLGLVLGGCRRR